MDNPAIVRLLNGLIQLDLDAIRAYRQALDAVSDADVYTHLAAFMADHDRHVRDLSRVIERHGGVPTAPRVDVTGFLLEGFTAVRSVTGTHGALAAMRANELLTNAGYDRALGTPDLPKDVHDLIRRHDEDEKRHLSWIQLRMSEAVEPA
ncbi:MAG: DUF2383 domain-containing protein [Myxococcota bacterium]